MLQKMSGYSKYFYETKRMNFLTEDGKLLKAYSKSWKKISNLIKKGVDNEPVWWKILKN